MTILVCWVTHVLLRVFIGMGLPSSAMGTEVARQSTTQTDVFDFDRCKSTLKPDDRRMPVNVSRFVEQEL